VGKPTGRVSVDRSSGVARVRLLILAKITASTILLAWILSRARLADVLAAMQAAHISLLLAAYSLDLIGYLISTERWRILLRAQAVEAPRGFLMKSLLVAAFFNNILPSTVGGDASRAYDSYRLAGRQGRAIASVLIERILGLLVLVAFALLSLPFATRLTDRWLLEIWLVIGGAGLVIVVWALFFGHFWPSLQRLLSRLPARLERLGLLLWHALQVYRGSRRALVMTVLLSTLLQVNVVLYYILISSALDLTVPEIHFFLIVPLVLFITMLPISINGIGLRENALAVILGWYGVTIADAVALAWLVYLGSLLVGLVGGIVYAVRH
jgi:glycosyltransferase 2 family protein